LGERSGRQNEQRRDQQQTGLGVHDHLSLTAGVFGPDGDTVGGARRQGELAARPFANPR